MFVWFLTSLALAEPSPTWTVSVDPLTTALGYVHVQTEVKISDHFSVYSGPHLRLFDPPWTAAADREPFLGVGIESGVRWFPKGQAPEGFWLMGRGVIAYAWATDSDASNPAGYGSGLFGYTWIVGDHLVLALGTGIQRIDYGVGDYGLHTFFPAAHTNIGWSW